MKILDFVRDMKERSLKELLDISEGGELKTQNFEFEAGRAELSTIRGNAIEKGAIAHLDLIGVKMPGTGEVFNSTVYQMEIFPKNPRCPMGHFNTEWSTAGNTVTYNMNLDLFPAVSVKEDLEGVQNQMGNVAKQFGRDPVESRKGLEIQYNMPHWPGSIASLAGLQLKQLEEQDLDLFVSAYRTFFDGYRDILKKRKDTPCNDQEDRLTIERNNRWLEYITLKDRAIKAAQAIGIPPAVIIGFSYPPRCGF